MLPIFLSAFTAVVSAVSAALPAVGTFCATIVPKITAVITNPQAWSMIGTVISTVAQVAQIFKPGESAEDMGDRAMQAAEAGVKSEDYDEWENYAEAIRNFELDPQKSEGYTVLEKTVAGVAVALQGLEQRFDVPAGALGPLPLLVAQNPEYFGADRLARILAVTRDVGAILAYFEDTLSGPDSAAVEQVLAGVASGMHPDKDTAAVKAELHTVAERFKDA